MLFVCAIVILDFMELLNVQYGQNGTCWIGNQLSLLLTFITPLIGIMLWNATFFILTANALHATMQVAQVALPSGENDRQQMIIYIKLASLMGFTWIFGILAAFFDHRLWSYLFVISNSVQGIHIGIAFGFNKRIRHMIALKVGWDK